MVWSLLIAPALASGVSAYASFGYWDAGDEAVEEEAEWCIYNSGSGASPAVWGGPSTGWDVYFADLAPYQATGVFLVSDHWFGYSHRCGVEDYGNDGVNLWMEPSCITGEAGFASVLFMSYDSWADEGRDLAYALASDATATAVYSPSVAFNSSGGGVDVVRRGTGRYLVRFEGITDGSGVPLTSPYTAGNTDLCRVTNWAVVGGGLNVGVSCLSGLTAADMPFSIAYTVGGVLTGADAAGGSDPGFYAYVNMSGDASPAVPAVSWTPDGWGDVEVSRFAPGQYWVGATGPSLPDWMPFSVQITNGPGDAVCEVTNISTYTGGGTVDFGVYCQNGRGWFVDSPFAVVASVGGG